jgi:hypothetical protein
MLYYAKNIKTSQILANASYEGQCIDKAVEAVRNSFFVGSINWKTAQTFNFDKFNKEQKLQFLEDNNVIVYQVT